MKELKEKNTINRDILKMAVEWLKELYDYNYEKMTDGEYGYKKMVDHRNEFIFLLSKHFYSKKVPFNFAKAVVEEIVGDDDEKDKRMKYFNHFYIQPLSEKELRKINQFHDFRTFIEVLATLRNIEMEVPEMVGIYTSVLALGYFDLTMNTFIWKPLVITPRSLYNGNNHTYFVNDPQSKVDMCGIYLLKRKGNRIGMNCIFKFYIDNVTVEWSNNLEGVKYTVSFKDPNNLYNFEVSKANLEDIIKTINNYVFGVKNSDMLLNSISSIIASFLSRQVEQSA